MEEFWGGLVNRSVHSEQHGERVKLRIGGRRVHMERRKLKAGWISHRQILFPLQPLMSVTQDKRGVEKIHLLKRQLNTSHLIEDLKEKCRRRERWAD